MSSMIPKAASSSTATEDKTLPAATYLYKEPMIEWVTAHIKTGYSDYKNKTNWGPIGQEKYEVGNIIKNIPGEVAKYNGYMELYFNKHKTANPALTRSHIKVKLSVFECGASKDDGYNEHCPFLHGIDINSLEKEEVISVDPKKEFKLCDAKDIEKCSSAVHEVIITDWFNSSVGSTVVIKSSNRANSDLASDRSNDFMEEAGKPTSKQFFKKFNHAM